MNKSVTSGQATVKRDLVVAPGRRGEAVCPLNALLQSQQPHPNSLSLVCRRLCWACQTTSSSIPAMLEAEPFMHSGQLNPPDGLNVCQSAITDSLSIGLLKKCITFFNEVKFQKISSCSTDMDLKKTQETDAEMYSTVNAMLCQPEKILRETLRWRICLFYIKYYMYFFSLYFVYFQYSNLVNMGLLTSSKQDY